MAENGKTADEIQAAFMEAFGPDALEVLRQRAEAAVNKQREFIDALLEAVAREVACGILCAFLPERLGRFIAWHLPVCLLPEVTATVIVGVNESEVMAEIE